MRKKLKRRKVNRAKSKLGLPDLEHAKSAVLVSLRSPESQRSYRRSIEDCLRRRKLVDLNFDHIQRREDHWAIVDLVGKGGHIRTVPMPDWVKQTIDDWVSTAQINHGRLFRCVCRRGIVWGTNITEKVVWHVVKEYAGSLGISKLAPHDLRRSCARLCHNSGGEFGADSIFVGSRFGSDGGEIPGLQAATSRSGE